MSSDTLNVTFTPKSVVKSIGANVTGNIQVYTLKLKDGHTGYRRKKYMKIITVKSIQRAKTRKGGI